MGAPESGMKAAEQPTADALLTSFRTIKDPERLKHVAVLDYWLSIRGDKEFPPLHDLDPLEISDAAPSSILFELLSGGQDAEVRHLGDALKDDVTVQRIIDASSPSLLSSIARKLPIVAISRDFLSFEDNFTNADGLTRCWITLLPLSSCGSWVDYVYAFVSLEKGATKAAKPAPKAEEPPVEEAQVKDVAEDVVVEGAEPVTEETDAPVDEVTEEVEAVAEAPAEEPEPLTEEPVVEELTVEAAEPVAEEVPVEVEGPVAQTAEPVAEEAPVEVDEPAAEPVAELEPVEDVAAELEPAAEPEPDPLPSFLTEEEPPAKSSPGFSGILEGLASLAGFYGQGVKVTDPVVEVDLAESEPLPPEPELEPEPVVEALEASPEPDVAVSAEPEPVAKAPEPEQVAEPEPEVAEAAPEPEPVADPEPLELEPPAPAMLEGTLQSKLAEVQAKADEAREAQVRATAALYEGLSAAYDFALDAETAPEEYLRLVEAQGLKIQLRAPMAPVAKLAFDGVCDVATIRQFEAVLAWALKVELPRGELIARINKAGGVTELLTEFSKAA
jgi:hypothetical protein